MECGWRYEAKSDVILTCKLTSTIADEDERMKQWNKLYTFSMGVKKDIDGANDVDDLSKQLGHTTISDKDSDSGESSATTESIPLKQENKFFPINFCVIYFVGFVVG